ncbi:cytochrome P450 [Rhizobium sp. ARZ01]|uniref:cytochrome P450 n=1 Tax=Rhizobium sp. ARZ01 TaxID=2769313 RepID=UPI0017847181|nr:cytochrome P450 [Rhizobium sp. ARZ01]MBD9375311.1 cytochrome P450 [Rhizobium sp. ARZ01]
MTGNENDISGLSSSPAADWDPRSGTVLSDQLRAYDHMRETCPVAHSDYLGWSLFKHEDVFNALMNHETFSNAVSRHPSVPNGMDPPQHTAYRRMIETYFTDARVDAFEPECRSIARELVASLPKAASTEFITEFAEPYAVRIQCAFLGWPASLHDPLRQWIRKNQKATLARDVEAMAAIALEFDGYIRRQLEERENLGPHAPDDITTSLIRQTINGRPLGHDEIVSMLRNWTVGELGTIAACTGIIAHFLAERPEVQKELRVNKALLPMAIDEILRLDAPLISNRRMATKAVEIGGRKIAAGDRITLMWASANRDEAAFDAATEFRLNRDPSQNLLYGAGIHVCPGAALARMELRVILEELLEGIENIARKPGEEPVRAIYPAGGFSSLTLRME